MKNQLQFLNVINTFVCPRGRMAFRPNTYTHYRLRFSIPNEILKSMLHVSPSPKNKLSTYRKVVSNLLLLFGGSLLLLIIIVVVIGFADFNSLPIMLGVAIYLLWMIGLSLGGIGMAVIMLLLPLILGGLLVVIGLRLRRSLK